MSDPFAISSREVAVALWTVSDKAKQLFGFVHAFTRKDLGRKWGADVLRSILELGQALDELAHYKDAAGLTNPMGGAGPVVWSHGERNSIARAGDWVLYLLPDETGWSAAAVHRSDVWHCSSHATRDEAQAAAEAAMKETG